MIYVFSAVVVRKIKHPLDGRGRREGKPVLFISDNPRSENTLQIIDDALPGLRGAGHKVEPDRRKAIRLALNEAMPGDVVLIAGKGHEKVQITREGTFPFDDVQVAREALQQMSYAGGRKEMKLLWRIAEFVRSKASVDQASAMGIPSIHARSIRATYLLPSRASALTGITTCRRR